MRRTLLLWVSAAAAGAALGHILEPEARQRRQELMGRSARRLRLAYVRQVLLPSQRYQHDARQNHQHRQSTYPGDPFAIQSHP
jgi:hypothetical protein